MNYNPIIIALGEPYSVFLEIFFKTFKKLKKKKKFRYPIIIIGSVDLLYKQMKYFKYNFKINIITNKQIKLVKNNDKLNIINIPLKQKKIFMKNNINSNQYISSSFDTAINILLNEKCAGFINGPISKKKFLKKKHNGITEYLAKKTKTKNVAMLIFNKQLSISPITTHIPIKKVSGMISKKSITKKILLVNNFYRKKLKINPKIAVLGLNPHCETTDKYSEEDKVILPAIKLLKKKKINIAGPFPADTFFLRTNYPKYDLVFGMYHDQVLTPIKTLYEFDAVNITVGLPFIRISPDHGPNEKMVGKGVSNIKSLEEAFKFFENFK